MKMFTYRWMDRRRMEARLITISPELIGRGIKIVEKCGGVPTYCKINKQGRSSGITMGKMH